jgi:serine/threonine protein kinase
MPDTGEIMTHGSTIPGRPLGTANYMAPERIQQGPLDPRSDLFSLGVVMYEMATGRLPFAAGSPFETVTNILEKDPLPVTELAPQRPAALGGIVARLLSKPVGDRYQTAEAVGLDLDALARAKGGAVSNLLRRLRPR